MNIKSCHFLLSQGFRAYYKGNRGNTLLILRFCSNLGEVGQQQTHFNQYPVNRDAEKQSVEQDSTHFGNQTVTKDEKAKKVHNVFENVANTYDLMNDLMSGGIHRLWKDKFVSRLGPTPGINLLDVGGGTGDVTFRILLSIRHQLKAQNRLQSELPEAPPLRPDPDGDVRPLSHQRAPASSLGKSKVTVCDISERMLGLGRERAGAHGFGANVEWVVGDAQRLPFPDAHFDAYTTAYGMRNVVDIPKALQEAYRVLRPGGRFLCLEFSQVKNSLIRSVYDLYSFQVIPVMGEVVAGDWNSYQYLVESIRKFPDQGAYKAMIEAAGFRRVDYEDMTFGVTAIHSGFKI